MKKFFLAAAFIVTAATTVLANDNENNAAVSSLLKKDFPAASNISYKEGKTFTTVSFVWNNQRLQAFYDNDGNKIGISRAIQLQSLPMSAYSTIQTKYAGYAATEAIEMDNTQDGVSYYVSLQNDTERLILHVTTTGELSVFRKTSL